MPKMIAKAALACGLLLSSVVAANAGENAWYVSGAGGMSFFNDADNSLSGGSFEASYNPGFAFVAAGGRQFDFGLRVEGEIGYRQASVDTVKFSGATGSLDGSGHSSALSFMANGLYDFDLGSRFKPYLGGGIGFANVSANNIKALNTTLVDDSAVVFAYQAIGGLGYAVTPQFTAFVEYRYFATSNPKFSQAGGTVESEFQTNNVMLGVRYAF